MNPQQIQLADGTKLEAYRCSCCGLIYSEREPYSSGPCCTCRDCGATIDPKVTKSRSTLCDACWGPHHQKIEDDRLERATEVQDYDGPVCVGDKYWATVADLIGERGDYELPEFAHTCHVCNYTVDVDDAIQNAVENGSYEDCDLSPDSFTGITELRAAADKFNEANKGTVYWEEDGKHKVRIRKAPATERATT